MTTHPMRDAALRYLELGLTPIPTQRSADKDKDKKALVPWKAFQDMPPTADDIRGWWERFPAANVALVTGKGLLVVDLDGDGAEKLLTDSGIILPANAPRVRTGNGQHVYLAGSATNRIAMLTTRGGKPQVDIRAAGGYVLAPPSLHANGTRYMWSIPLMHPLPAAPESLLRMIASSPASGSATQAPQNVRGWFAESWAGVPEGQRDATCAKLAGYLLRRGHEPIDAFVMLVEWGKRCTPPLPESDVRKVVASISKREAASGRVHATISDTPLPQSTETDEAEIVHISEAINRMDEEARQPHRPLVPSPFPGLSDMLNGGFRPSQLTYLAARPSVGKSALSIELARAATRSGKRTMLVSLESREAQIAQRTVSQEGKHSASDLARGVIDESTRQTMGRLSDRNLWITKSSRMETIIAQLDRLWPIEFLIVDYLQLIGAPGHIRDRRQQVEWISRTFKQLAQERDIPVVVLSSVARTGQEGGVDKAPTLGSLRESGELEHDADVVLILHRPEKNNFTTLCHVAKNRDGRTGVVELMFQPEFVSFFEIDKNIGEPPPAATGGWFGE